MSFYCQLIALPEVRNLTSLSKTVIYALMKEGRFPRPVRISPRRVAWRLSEVRAWILAQAGVVDEVSGDVAIKVLTLHQVLSITSLRKSTLYDLVAKGDFPNWLSLSNSRSGWLQHQVHDWIRQRVYRDGDFPECRPRVVLKAQGVKSCM